MSRLALASRAGTRARPLRDAAVAHLRVAEGAPGDLAGALALARTEALRRSSPRSAHRAAARALSLEGPIATRQSIPERCGSERTSSRLACAPPARVGVAEAVVVPHEPVRLADVGHACGREGRAAGVAAAGVLAGVALHAEVPLVALLGLVHLGVARARRALGRAGRLHGRAPCAGARPRRCECCAEIDEYVAQKSMRFLRSSY